MTKGCSQCCEGTLASRAAEQKAAVDNAETGDLESWTYYECDRCGFRVKESLEGRIEMPDTEEWEKFCDQTVPIK